MYAECQRQDYIDKLENGSTGNRSTQKHLNGLMQRGIIKNIYIRKGVSVRGLKKLEWEHRQLEREVRSIKYLGIRNIFCTLYSCLSINKITIQALSITSTCEVSLGTACASDPPCHKSISQSHSCHFSDMEFFTASCQGLPQSPYRQNCLQSFLSFYPH